MISLHHKACRFLVLTLCWLPAAPATGDEMALIVPNRTIYPRELIKEDDFTTRYFVYDPSGPSLYIQDIKSFVGYAARTTLPAFKPVRTASLERQRRIQIGNAVKIVYSAGGLEIVTLGTALQHGAVGEVIQVRNTQSNIIIDAIIQSDGNVRIPVN